MLTIARLRFRNWKCFWGETVLDLEPKVYGVFARDESDSRRSNWLGKSSITEAVDYCLTGRYPKPTAARPAKSGWITDGEDKGEVEIVFSNGASAKRTMGRKDAERLYYFPPGDPERGAVGDAAQQKIDELLGLSREDAATWCFRQGEMSALLKMDPGPRMEMFSNWFRLGKLEECQGLAAAARGAIAKQVEEARKVLESWRLGRDHRLEGIGKEHSLAEQIELARETIALWEVEVEKGAAREKLARERAELEGDAARYDRIVEEGKRLSNILLVSVSLPSQLEAERPKLAAEVEEFSAERVKAFDDARTVARVGAGHFDGKCPIAGEACPAGDFVVRATALNRTRLTEANAKLEEWTAALAGARDRLALVEGRIRDRERLEAQIAGLRIQARELAPRRARWQALGEVSAAPAASGTPDARNALRGAQERLQGLLGIERFVADAEAKMAVARAEVDRLERVAAIPSAAALVFERARRQIAEGVLSEIEGLANEVLVGVGADLSVAITWGRDGAGLADACAGCGAAYPPSRKIKHCARCGAERGQKLVERLDIEPSMRSGAADDLGSIAVTLGASRWLREDRGSEWATATMDEATAAFDAVHVESFMGLLPRALKIAGIAQSLVISHHRGALEGLPGRIEVISKGGRSTARVVA